MLEDEVRIGARARVGLYLILNAGKWCTLEEVVNATGLAPITATQALTRLVRRYPRLFERDGQKFRFKGVFRVED